MPTNYAVSVSVTISEVYRHDSQTRCHSEIYTLSLSHPLPPSNEVGSSKFEIAPAKHDYTLRILA